MKKIKFLLALLVLTWLAIDNAAAQVLQTPQDYVKPENVSLFTQAITALVTVFVGYFSALIPGLKALSNKTIRIIVTSLIVVAGAGAFKWGFLTRESFEFAVVAFLPNFGGSAFVYETLRFFLGLFGVKIKTVQPEAAQ